MDERFQLVGGCGSVNLVFGGDCFQYSETFLDVGDGWLNGYCGVGYVIVRR